MLSKVQVLEYVWLDAEGGMRSKSKVLYENHAKNVSDCQIWNFDGSSTNQAKTESSDVFLKPVRLYNDPFRKEVNAKIVLCECYDDLECKKPNKFNRRLNLVKVFENNKIEESLCGIE